MVGLLVGGGMWLAIGALGPIVALLFVLVLRHEGTEAAADRAAPRVAEAAEGILRLENLPLALAVVHRDGRVITANRALRRLLGYDLTELVNRPIWDFHADPIVGKASFAQLLEQGVLPDREALYRGRDGRTVATTSTAIVARGQLAVLVTVSARR